MNTYPMQLNRYVRYTWHELTPADVEDAGGEATKLVEAIRVRTHEAPDAVVEKLDRMGIRRAG